MDNPFEIFEQWYHLALEQPNVKIPSACCFTSIGIDGFPNSRFVSLKDIKDDAFIISGPINSRKGIEVGSNPKVSLAFWWDRIDRQVRIQGEAVELSKSDAKSYFSKRSRTSQIVSTLFEQGEVLENFDELKNRFDFGLSHFENQDIPKPSSWSGFVIRPIRIEFMEFAATRLHKRTLYTKEKACWSKCYLQP